MNAEINKTISVINTEIQRLKAEASDMLDAINYMKEAAEGHEKGIHLLESYINDLTKGLSINTSPINIGSSSGPHPQQEPVSNPIVNRTISIETESPKATSSKKFIKINNSPSEEEEKSSPLNPKEEEYK